MIRNRTPDQSIFIYRIFCENTCYIGQTSNISRRITSHNLESKKGLSLSQKNKWLTECKRRFTKPTVEVLQIAKGPEMADDLESYWAYHYKRLGWNVVNDFAQLRRPLE